MGWSVQYVAVVNRLDFGRLLALQLLDHLASRDVSDRLQPAAD